METGFEANKIAVSKGISRKTLSDTPEWAKNQRFASSVEKVSKKLPLPSFRFTNETKSHLG